MEYSIHVQCYRCWVRDGEEGGKYRVDHTMYKIKKITLLTSNPIMLRDNHPQTYEVLQASIDHCFASIVYQSPYRIQSSAYLSREQTSIWK